MNQQFDALEMLLLKAADALRIAQERAERGEVAPPTPTLQNDLVDKALALRLDRLHPAGDGRP